MTGFKTMFMIVLISAVVTGCSYKPISMNMSTDINKISTNSNSQAQLNKGEESDKKDKSSDNKTSTNQSNSDSTTTDVKTSAASSAKPSTDNSSALPKTNNSPKKIIAAVNKNNIPPTKPTVVNTVQKVQIQPPPAPVNQTNNVSNSQSTQQSGEQPLGQVQSQTTSGNIPGLPQFNYEVKDYQGYYNAIYSSLKDFQSSVYIKLDNYSDSLYNLNVVDTIMTDNYDVDYGLKSVGAELYSMGNINILNVQFNYNLSRDKLLAMRNASQAKANEIIDSIIKTGMTDFDKEKAIHDYVVIHTAYDYNDYINGTLPAAAFNDYGVLINGSAVCEGYSKAMLKLMRLAGLQAKSVVGYGLDGNNKIPHAWNMVKINGVYTMVDATWDDPIPDEKNKVYYNYFDVSDSALSKDHLWDMNKYPRASSITVN